MPIWRFHIKNETSLDSASFAAVPLNVDDIDCKTYGCQSDCDFPTFFVVTEQNYGPYNLQARREKNAIVFVK